MIDEVARIAREAGVNSLSLYTICETGNTEVFEKLDFRVVSEAPADWAVGANGQPLSEAYMIRRV